MKSNSITSLFTILIVLFCITSPAHAEAYSAKHEGVKKLFKSNEEKTAKDAIWTAKNIFKVGVIDDGSRRDDYAQYICSVLYDYGFQGKGIWVQVIDIMKLTVNNKWVKLGVARCN